VLQLSWKGADQLGRIGRRTVSRLQAAIDRDLKPRSGILSSSDVIMSVAIEPAYKSLPNIVGVLPGTTHKDEYVVVGGHFDHIGVVDDGHGMCRPVTRRNVTDKICNGADDNASGSAVVLAIAEAFQRMNLQPARSIIFAHFSGEELGLLGSGELVNDPNFPTSDVTAMINLDMVGRAAKGGVAIGGIKSSGAWLPILDEIESYAVRTVFESEVAGRSDHANFYTQGIPVLFFFTGLHGDYHRATDNLDKLDTDGMTAIASLVFEVVKRAADGRTMPYVAPTTGDGIVSALPGTNPDTIIKTIEPTPQEEP
jgi:Zn-dependent M28 family amino/carboxypeptidase